MQPERERKRDKEGEAVERERIKYCRRNHTTNTTKLGAYVKKPKRSERKYVKYLLEIMKYDSIRRLF